MLPTDIVIIASLIVFVVLWWVRGIKGRSVLLAMAALIILGVGLFSVSIFRWQGGVGAAAAGVFLLVLLINKLRGADKKTGVPFISGTFFALLAAASALAIYWFPIKPLPAPSGDHPVGVRDFVLVDDTRKGVNGVGPDVARKLLVRVWYPAGDVSGIEPRPYYNKGETVTSALAIGKQIGAPFFGQSQALIKTNSYENAPLASGATDLPTIIYSHGYGSHLAQNTALMEELASHGYAVYSVHHTGDAGTIPTPDGALLEMDPAVVAQQTAPSEEEMAALSEQFLSMLTGETFDQRLAATNQYREDGVAEDARTFTLSPAIWTADRIFVHDQLEAGAVPNNVEGIVSASRLDRTGQMGMSYGGSTTGRVCQIDRRCAAGVNLDGGDFHYDPFNETMRAPFMMMYAESRDMLHMFDASDEQIARARMFNDFSYERHELAGLSEDIHRVVFLNAGHGTYSDMKWHIRAPFFGVILGNVDPAVALSVQNDFVRGFFDKYVKGLEGGFPAAQLEQYTGVVEKNDISDRREWWVAANPEDETVQVVLETDRGDVELALYPERAPISVANFLAYVEAGHYDGATFYRASQGSDAENALDIVQGGVISVDEYLNAIATQTLPTPPLPPIAHETTTATGIPNERGVIAFGRLDVGTAASEFFINLEDNPRLDTPDAQGDLNDAGYATFGRVLRGHSLLEEIQSGERLENNEASPAIGQILKEPVIISRAYVVE